MFLFLYHAITKFNRGLTQETQMDNYRAVSRPFLKVFLGAMLVHQLLYWSWEKMRTDEEKEEMLGMWFPVFALRAETAFWVVLRENERANAGILVQVQGLESELRTIKNKKTSSWF